MRRNRTSEHVAMMNKRRLDAFKNDSAFVDRFKAAIAIGHPKRAATMAAPEYLLGKLERRSIPEPNSGCLLWLGHVDEDGYGRFNTAGRQVLAHRKSWELHNGKPIPEGLCVCHKCDVPGCINPAHLFLGTNLDNLADKYRKGRHCFGERQGRALLTDAQVTEIRALLVAGVTRQEIADRLGVNRRLVDNTCRPGTWRHIPYPVAA